MKIVAVRIGDRYGPEYETYLESKLPEYEFVWIRNELDRRVKLQWNKMFAMAMDEDEPICVMDIDVLLINDYKKIFEYPIKKGQFLAAPGWWRWGFNDLEERFTINGGFYKYYPKDCKYIFDKFMSDPEHWQTHYIKEGFTSGPVNGEQHFINDSVKERLELITLPNEWFCRMEARKGSQYTTSVSKLNTRFQQVTGNNYAYLGGEFWPTIKFVHFTHMANHPHNWADYKLFTK
jgi:hypothetical protein